MPSPSTRPTFSPAQVHQIYTRINLPRHHRHDPGPSTHALARGPDALSYLTTLQRAVLTTVPFENLELHYSATKTIVLDPHLLFDKIVSQNTGRGGYCMENNAFFGTLLRSLGFAVTSVGGRVNTANQPSGHVAEGADVYTGFGHMVNLVAIEGRRYMVDVGFGVGGPTRPLLLEDGAACEEVGARQGMRVRWDGIEENENEAAKVWIYERREREGAWRSVYCFPDGVEFLPQDFEVMNMGTSLSRKSFFTYTVICSRFEADEEGGITGAVVLFGGKVRRKIGGEREHIVECHTEGQRVDALERHLGVRLRDSQKAGIKGMVTALPA